MRAVPCLQPRNAAEHRLAVLFAEFPKVHWRSIVMSVSVCSSVYLSFVSNYPRAYLRNCVSNLHFFVRVTYGRGSVLFW